MINNELEPLGIKINNELLGIMINNELLGIMS